MIDDNRLGNALYALQGLILKAKMWAYEGVDSDRIARLLEQAEHVPSLIARNDHTRDTFLRFLERVSSDFDCPGVVDRFHRTPERW